MVRRFATVRAVPMTRGARFGVTKGTASEDARFFLFRWGLSLEGRLCLYDGGAIYVWDPRDSARCFRNGPVLRHRKVSSLP